MPKPLNTLSMTPGSPVRPKHCLLLYIHWATSGAHSIANHSIASKPCLIPIAWRTALYSLDHITRPQLGILHYLHDRPCHWHHIMHHNLEALQCTHVLSTHCILTTKFSNLIWPNAYRCALSRDSYLHIKGTITSHG